MFIPPPCSQLSRPLIVILDAPGSARVVSVGKSLQEESEHIQANLLIICVYKGKLEKAVLRCQQFGVASLAASQLRNTGFGSGLRGTFQKLFEYKQLPILPMSKN